VSGIKIGEEKRGSLGASYRWPRAEKVGTKKVSESYGKYSHFWAISTHARKGKGSAWNISLRGKRLAETGEPSV